MPSRRRGSAPLAVFLALFALLALAPAASAAQKLVTIRTPSPFVDPATQSFNGDDHPGRLQANVLLPDGYAAKPRKRWPLLLLLHGAGDNWESWTQPERGDIRNTAKGLNAIVVMPEGARGFYTDWFNGGKRRDPAWERHIREYLLPLIERRFRVRAGRRWHAIAGLSMGGYGTLLTASQYPGYFGTAVPMSAFANPQRPEVEPFFPVVTNADYETIYGPRTGFYATGHNPVELAANLRHTRLYVFTGDGTQDPEKPPASNPGSLVLEGALRPQNDEFVTAAQKAGVTVTYTVHRGAHDWPYWREDLQTAIQRGLFRPLVTRSPRAWRYRTVSQRGRMWRLRYRFAKPPTEVVDFTRRGRRLSATGSGRVTITAAGCGVSKKLPFRTQFPPSRCR